MDGAGAVRLLHSIDVPIGTSAEAKAGQENTDARFAVSSKFSDSSAQSDVRGHNLKHRSDRTASRAKNLEKQQLALADCAKELDSFARIEQQLTLRQSWIERLGEPISYFSENVWFILMQNILIGDCSRSL